MTNWNRIKEIDRINQRELDLNIGPSGSWHNRYSHSAYIYVGNIHFDLNEGDLITVFSQFGEIVDCNLIRDKETGDPKGFAFIAFENQKSTNLAVDNMNGAILLKRTLNVDHVNRYRKPKHFKDRENKMKDNQYGDVDEDDETYEQRRKKIWDYQKYYGLSNNDNNNDKDNKDILSTKQTVKFDQKEVDKINKQYLNEKKDKENKFEKSKSALDKKIEIRKLKRKLLRIKKNEKNDHNDKNKRFKRKDNDNKNNENDEWIDNGSELRDKFGRIINIEKELEKRKKLEEIEKRQEYEEELREIKEEKKRKKRAKKSKSQLLNSKLKKLNKKMKKDKKKNKKQSKYKGPNNGIDGDGPPKKKRKFDY